MKRLASLWLAGLAQVASVSCGDGSGQAGTSRVRLLVQAEATVTEGLDQGEGVENTEDYSVRYSKFLVTLGNVHMQKSNADADVWLRDVFVADLRKVGEQGMELGVLDNVEAGQWDRFGFDTPAANAKTRALGDVSEGDLAAMIAHGWTYWIEGDVLRDEAAGGPVHFVIQTEAATRFTDCELDGEPGVSVVADGTASATLTIHGDHIFFNSFLTGSEGNIRRLSGWMIAADADQDGLVTSDELKSLDASEVFTSAAGYNLDGKPADIQIFNALDFVRAQLTTQAHFNGEGECVSTFVGAARD